MANYFQIGGDVAKPVYTGEVPAAVYYTGKHKTVALPAAAAQNDTVELLLCKIPAGAKISSIAVVIDGSMGTATSAVLTLRKKTNTINPPTTIAGSDVTNTGVATGTPDKTVQVNGANWAVTTTSANNAAAIVIPATFEGLNPGFDNVQEDYDLGLKVTFGATPTWNTGVTVFARVGGEFVGNN